MSATPETIKWLPADDPRRVRLWDAINEYAKACHDEPDSVTDRRMNAVVAVERAVEDVARAMATFDGSTPPTTQRFGLSSGTGGSSEGI